MIPVNDRRDESCSVQHRASLASRAGLFFHCQPASKRNPDNRCGLIPRTRSYVKNIAADSPSKSLEISESTSNSPSAISVTNSSARRSLEQGRQAPPHRTAPHRLTAPPTSSHAAFTCPSDTSTSNAQRRKVDSFYSAIKDITGAFQSNC